MLLYLFFDLLLSTCPKEMETAKWPKTADSPLWRLTYRDQCCKSLLFNLINFNFEFLK